MDPKTRAQADTHPLLTTTRFALRRIEAQADGEKAPWACTRRGGEDYLLLFDTARQALDLAAKAGVLEWTEPVALIPGVDTNFERFGHGGVWYDLTHY